MELRLKYPILDGDNGDTKDLDVPDLALRLQLTER
jgi:hypothetical protein